MNRRKLIRILEDCGAIFEEEGGKHTLYRNPRSKAILSVPRHREISPGVTRQLIRDACDDQ